MTTLLSPNQRERERDLFPGDYSMDITVVEKKDWTDNNIMYMMLFLVFVQKYCIYFYILEINKLLITHNQQINIFNYYK